TAAPAATRQRRTWRMYTCITSRSRRERRRDDGDLDLLRAEEDAGREVLPHRPVPAAGGERPPQLRHPQLPVGAGGGGQRHRPRVRNTGCLHLLVLYDGEPSDHRREGGTVQGPLPPNG